MPPGRATSSGFPRIRPGNRTLGGVIAVVAESQPAHRGTQRYQLVSRQRAEQSVAFTDQYRSYVINYGLGQDLVRRHVESAGDDPAARWAAMERILSQPTVPADLLPAQ